MYCVYWVLTSLSDLGPSSPYWHKCWYFADNLLRILLNVSVTAWFGLVFHCLSTRATDSMDSGPETNNTIPSDPTEWFCDWFSSVGTLLQQCHLSMCRAMWEGYSVGSLSDREVAGPLSDRQGSNFKSKSSVSRTVQYYLSSHPHSLGPV